MRSAAPRFKEGPPTNTAARTGKWKGVLQSLKPEWVFLALAIVFGGAFLFVTPPFEVPDEEAHFRRAFDLSEGRIIALKQGDFTGDYLPRALGALFNRFAAIRVHPEEKTSAKAILDAAEISVDPTDREFVVFSNAAIHPPVPYLPQALAIFLARQFTLSALIYLYAGRVLNLLATTALTFVAIRITPIAKWGFAALALTPMTLSLTASLSPDALTNCLSFLLIAQVLACACGPVERLSGRAVLMMGVSGAAVGLAKQAYFLLPLSYLLIPVSKLGNPRRYWGGFGLVMGMTFLAVGGWSFVVRAIYSPSDLSFGMNPAEQIRLMISDPLSFVLVLLRTSLSARFFTEEYLGWLGLVDLRLPTPLYIVEITVLAMVFIGTYDPRMGLTARQALLALVVALLVVLTVLVIVHITWDKVGAINISAQGRYFIPAGPLFGIAAARLGKLVPGFVARASETVPTVFVVAVPIVLATAFATLHDRYFVDGPQAAAQRAYMQGMIAFGASGQQERARALFEDALQKDFENIGAHFYLALLIEKSEPAKAAEHLRFVLQKDPVDVAALNNLGNILAREADYQGAIKLFREAIRINPDDENLKQNLKRTQSSLEAAQGAPRHISKAIEDTLVRSAMLEERHRGEPGEGLYLKPIRGRVLNAAGGNLFGRAEMLWRCPPPSGEEIRLFDLNGKPVSAVRPIPFYACSAEAVGPNRVFVFPPPKGAAVLADEAVSWFFQVSLAELSPAGHAREQAYRMEKGLRFPLSTLP